MALVVRQRLSEQVAQHLRELIVEGEIAAGQALPPERQLTQRFGVSSVVVREALNSLSVTGLVEIRHGVGSFVTPPDQWRIEEPFGALIRSGRVDLPHMVEARAMIEVEMSALAALRRDEEAIHLLDAALADMAESLHDPVANVDADMAFHRALATGAGNPALWILLQPMLAPILAGMFRGTSFPAATSRALAEHRNIRDAIVAGDPSAARLAMRAHMETSRLEVTGRANPAEEKSEASRKTHGAAR
ncbi:MAG TPA: FadR/GntR family transcriptional regulator [Chloroflexota bacterium]|jgi:DNA-binding FadR family transcriptional regulator